MPDLIPPELQQFVDHEVAIGTYRSAAEAISDGLRLLRAYKLHRLRQDIDAGLRQLEHGEGIELADEPALNKFFEDLATQGRQRLEAARGGK